MATTKEECNIIVKQIGLENVRARAMMGEYLLYYNDILFGGIYDKRLLVKKTIQNEKYGLEEQIPYDGAKAMYWIKDFSKKAHVHEIILDTYEAFQKTK